MVAISLVKTSNIFFTVFVGTYVSNVAYFDAFADFFGTYAGYR
jgi:hypothetical protein